MKKTFLVVSFLAVLGGACPVQAKEVLIPAFEGIAQWLNTTEPLVAASLKGKVVLIDFWTYSCINCIRTFPYVKSWHDKYKDQGLVVIGVHTPEFEFEKNALNVKAALKKYGLTYPVAMDNDYRVWNAYANRYWPAHYLFDRGGVLKYRHFGEGNYDAMEAKIRELLAQGGKPLPLTASSKTAEPDLSKVKTPEMYLGYHRTAYLGNAQKIIPDKAQDFKEPKKIGRNKFYLSGKWLVAKEYAFLDSPQGKVIVRFNASKVNLVMASEGEEEILAEIVIDGKPATAVSKGEDVYIEEGKAFVKIAVSRLYQLAQTTYGEHVLEIRFFKRGARLYAFTYG